MKTEGELSDLTSRVSVRAVVCRVGVAHLPAKVPLVDPAVSLAHLPSVESLMEGLAALLAKV